VAEKDKTYLISRLSGGQAESLVIHDMKIRFISQKDPSVISYSVDIFGIYDAPHNILFESNSNNNFLGILCIAKA
jgi:hypothetical protein